MTRENDENIPENAVAKLLNYDVDEATEQIHKRVNEWLKGITDDFAELEDTENPEEELNL